MLSNPAASASTGGGRRGSVGHELNDDNDIDIDDQVGTVDVELWEDEFRPSNGYRYSDTGNINHQNHNHHGKSGQFHHLPSSFRTSPSASSSSSSSFEMVPTATRKNNDTDNKYYVDNNNDDDDSDNGMQFNYDDDEDYFNDDDDDDDDRRLVHQQQQSKRRRRPYSEVDDDNDNSGDDYHLQSNLLSLLLSKSTYQYLYPPQVPKSIQLYRLENIAIPACYLLVGILQGLSGPFTNVYPLDLNASEAQQVSRV